MRLFHWLRLKPEVRAGIAHSCRDGDLERLDDYRAAPPPGGRGGDVVARFING
jgi:hypothetical protein